MQTAKVRRGAARGKDLPSASAIMAGSPVVQVLELLSEAGFGSDVVSGYMDAASEFDGGRYGLVLSQDGKPVSAATFNVFGPQLPAQVCMVATANEERGRGHCAALFEVLSSMLEILKVETVILQPPPGSNTTWAKKLGFSPMHPASVADLHMAMPIAYLDAPVLELPI